MSAEELAAWRRRRPLPTIRMEGPPMNLPATPTDHITRAMEEPTPDDCQRCRLSTAGWCAPCGGPIATWCCGRRWIELLVDGHHPECNYWTPTINQGAR